LYRISALSIAIAIALIQRFALSISPRFFLPLCFVRQQMLIAMLDEHCMECNRQLLAASNAEIGMGGDLGKASPPSASPPLSAFDFVYLPIDFK
jgi:hypothetical protein